MSDQQEPGCRAGVPLGREGTPAGRLSSQPYPILECDPAPEAVIEPSRLVEGVDLPEHCVVCFFSEVIAQVIEGSKARQVWADRSEQGVHPV